MANTKSRPPSRPEAWARSTEFATSISAKIAEMDVANSVDHLGENRVVKVLRSDHLTDITTRQRFLQEARTAASIKHPNVAILHDFATLPDGTHYMVEEYVDGRTIAE